MRGIAALQAECLGVAGHSSYLRRKKGAGFAEAAGMGYICINNARTETNRGPAALKSMWRRPDITKLEIPPTYSTR